MDLFNGSVEEVKKIPIDKTCKDCEHRQRWECGASIFQYCGVRKSNRTENGLLKIKCKTEACSQFKEIEL